MAVSPRSSGSTSGRPAGAVVDADVQDLPAEAVAAAASVPAALSVRLDRADANRADYHVSTIPGGWEIQTGPHGIAWDPSQVVSGDFTLSATLTEVGAPPGHREGLGLFFGGSDLEGPSQRYSYFLVRADGRYLIKRRLGEETPNVTDGWIEESAVHSATGAGDVTNALSVVRVGDLVHFAVNGTQVATLPTSEVDVDGIVGVRVSHNLQVRVEDWTVSR